MLRRAVVPFFVLGGTLIGCIAPEESSDTPRTFRAPPAAVGEGSEAIAGGYLDSTDPAAVGIFIQLGQESAICSGSLLAPNMVLTARHCVSQTNNDANGVHCSTTDFGPTFNPNRFYVTTKTNFPQSPSAYRSVAEVVPLPVGDSLLCGQDMAILILAENIPAEEATPYVPRVDTALGSGEQYYAVGYGSTDDYGNGAGSRRRRDTLYVACAEDGCGERYDMTFSEWLGDTGICSGDSGGPALDLQNRVVGVTSRGVQGCDDPVYGATHAWGEWIKETAARAATMGGYDPASWVTGWPTDPAFSFEVGQACTDGAECASSYCFRETCTRQCNEAAPCPEGYACEAPDAAGGVSICTVPAEDPPPDEDDAASASSGGSSDDATDAGGCTIGLQRDPVTPVPWLVGAALALGLARRRRR